MESRQQQDWTKRYGIVEWCDNKTDCVVKRKVFVKRKERWRKWREEKLLIVSLVTTPMKEFRLCAILVSNTLLITLSLCQLSDPPKIDIVQLYIVNLLWKKSAILREEMVLQKGWQVISTMEHDHNLWTIQLSIADLLSKYIQSEFIEITLLLAHSLWNVHWTKLLSKEYRNILDSGDWRTRRPQELVHSRVSNTPIKRRKPQNSSLCPWSTSLANWFADRIVQQSVPYPILESGYHVGPHCDCLNLESWRNSAAVKNLQI